MRIRIVMVKGEDIVAYGDQKEMDRLGSWFYNGRDDSVMNLAGKALIQRRHVVSMTVEG